MQSKHLPNITSFTQNRPTYKILTSLNRQPTKQQSEENLTDGSLAHGNFRIFSKGYLELEVINNNEVKLWDYTTETLDLILGVEQ